MAEWMIYGANGFTGELIAREAAGRGMRPILAGRSRSRIESLARELGLPYRTFDLSRPEMEGVKVVLHSAGPFVRTAAPMVDACLSAGIHYLDITGEIEVFEATFAMEAVARAAGVALVPGVGFDVVPTDCLAAQLSVLLPDATELVLAFATSRGSSASRGTLKTMLEGAPTGGRVRQDGRIRRVPLVHDVMDIPFPGGTRTAMAIPWGDVSTAYRTTGIPNIRVYSAASRRSIARLRMLSRLAPLLAITPLRRALQRLAERAPGPGEKIRAEGRVEVWGRVRNPAGEERTLSLSTPEAYAFTAASAVNAVERVLTGGADPGAHTPSHAFGADFVSTVPGVRWR
jgi:short subunit dehydrogenase-like uncharacterized protein